MMTENVLPRTCVSVFGCMHVYEYVYAYGCANAFVHVYAYMYVHGLCSCSCVCVCTCVCTCADIAHYGSPYALLAFPSLAWIQNPRE